MVFWLYHGYGFYFLLYGCVIWYWGLYGCLVLGFVLLCVVCIVYRPKKKCKNDKMCMKKKVWFVCKM